MIRLLFVFILINLPFLVEAQTTPQIDNILVIHSYHQGLQWTDGISAGINSILRDEQVEIHYEYLDTKRNSGELYYQEMVQFEQVKKSLSNIDFKLIICSDNNALRYMMDYGEMIYPGIPIVFCGINNFTIEMINRKSNVTGIEESIDYASTLELIRNLHPERKNVLFIIDRTPTGKLIKDELVGIIEKGWDDFNFEFYQDFELNDVPEKVSALGADDVIFLLTFNQDIKGKFISYYDGIKMIHNSSKVPIYGAWDFYFGNGIVGGMLTTGESQGIAAAELAKKILNGVPIKDLGIIKESPNTLMFDYTELERFGIRLDILPENSIIINRPESLIQNIAKYFLQIIIISFIVLGLLFIRLVQQKKQKKQLTKMNMELEKRVQEKTANLTEKVLQIEEKNRDLNSALEQIRTLKGIIPICSHCKNIRNDQGYWKKVEHYISESTDAVFSHGLCPDCITELYPDIADKIIKET